MARKSHDDGGGGQEWMNTYSDLVTLLMTFFVLLFSMSSVDAEKWETFVKALAKDNANTSQIVINRPEDEGGDSPLTNNGDANQLAEGINPTDEPTPLPTDFDDLYAFLQKYVEENNLGAAIEISKSGDNVVYIRFRNNIFFMPDKSDLLPEGMEVLSYLGDCLAAVQDQIHLVSINGHTAQTDDPDYSVSDWMLSGERASRVADYLDNEKGFAPEKLRPMGYGKNFPIADNATKEGREQNRRVDITIVREDNGQSVIESQLADLFDPAQFPKSGGADDLFSAAPEDGITSTAGADELPPPASDDATPDTPGSEATPPPESSSGEVIPPPESSDGTVIPPPESSGGTVIPPPESSSGTVIPPPDTTGGTSTAPIAGTQDQ